MNLKLRKMTKPINGWSLLFLFVIMIWNSSIAFCGMAAPKLGNPYRAVNREANLVKILTVLKNEIGDQQLLEKAKDKLSTLSDRQMLLLASLSDRITNGGNTAGADIAFLWITILIVLS
jgi:hypothetical protein